MRSFEQEKNLCTKILKKSHPELYASILEEVQKGLSEESLGKVREVKKVFEKAGVTDNRLFVAVVIKIFHPALYERDNKDIPLQRGLHKEITKALGLYEGNTTVLIKQVRTWLKFNIEELKERADSFFEKYLNGAYAR